MFPWGPCTITLHYVALLLGLPIDGLAVAIEGDGLPHSAHQLRFGFDTMRIKTYKKHKVVNNKNLRAIFTRWFTPDEVRTSTSTS